MDVREFRDGDGAGLRALWTEAGFRLIGDDDAGLRRFAERNPGRLLVVEADSSIVGSALGGFDGHRGWIYHVAVAPAHRRTGIASELVRRLERELRAAGCPRVLVQVEADNDAALAFWITAGYVERGTTTLGKTL